MAKRQLVLIHGPLLRNHSSYSCQSGGNSAFAEQEPGPAPFARGREAQALQQLVAAAADNFLQDSVAVHLRPGRAAIDAEKDRPVELDARAERGPKAGVLGRELEVGGALERADPARDGAVAVAGWTPGFHRHPSRAGPPSSPAGRVISIRGGRARRRR